MEIHTKKSEKDTKIFLWILFTLLILISGLYFFYKIDKIKHETFTQTAKQIKNQFQEEVNLKYGGTGALTYVISQDPKIIDALVHKDNSRLNYQDTIKNIERYGTYKNLWIQITDKDGYSFYRSWTSNVGDHAASARVDIADMIKRPRPMQTISAGRFDLTFKTMVPLYNGKEFIGMIELISKFNSIAKIFKDSKIEPIFTLHEDYTKHFIKPFSELFIGNNYVANLNASKTLMQEIEQEGLKSFFSIKEYKIFKNYFVVLYEIRDLQDKDMGYFLFFKDLEDIDYSLLDDFKINFLIVIVLLMIILTLSIFYFNNKKFLEKLRDEVEKQTNKIKKQKEYLSSILDIYDKHVIFSKTDLKGIITHASEAFCRISGYTKEELIGKNHNIVRAEDTPSELFEHLWEDLKQQKNVTVTEIKNRKKDGTYYWVEAEFEPYYDEKGNHIGYSAVRNDITVNKEIELIQKEIIFTMGTIGESRSKETGNHVKRVALYSELLARYSGLDEEEVSLIAQASPMHDIGKVAISDNILKKPDKLNTEEFSTMKKHAQIGYEMFKNSNRPLLQTAAIISYTHHEKWDGTGYPRNLKGEEIHIYGRITAIADVFDALGSDRCYKKAWKDEDIFKLLKDEKGKHFDPKLIDLFFENIDKFKEIRDKYKD